MMNRRNDARDEENDSRASLPQPRQGFARWQDVEDAASQAVAPRGQAHELDRSGERRYEAGLRNFVDGHDQPAWELDEGGVQFGHAGRGPLNYKRSDARLREEVCERLTDADDVDATHIEVAVHDGIVTLAGEVATRAQRRDAEDIAAAVSGVGDVLNQLRIAPAQRSTPG
jgi:osmotically-inducible protein OsmY